MTTKTQEYQFDRSKGKNVARVAAYHRRDYDLAVIRINPRDHENIRHSISQPFDRASSVTLGKLQLLPLEVLHEMLLLLDIHTLLRFRQLNGRAREAVCTLQGYRLVMTHALEAICVLLRTHMAAWFTLSNLLNVLCTRDCLACGSFGGFIFLPSLTKCCLPCLTTSPHFRLIQLGNARKRFNLAPDFLRKSMPILMTVPGIYSMDETSRKGRIPLLSEKEIMSAFDVPKIAEIKEPPILRYMAATSLPYLEKASGDIQYGICCSGCQIALEKAIYVSTVKDSVFALRDRVYSQEGFVEHFQACAEAQALWKQSKEGTIPVKMPESIRRRGYFNRRDVVMSFDKQLR